MSKIRILVVDDEEGMLEVCKDILGKIPEAEIVVEKDPLKAANLLLRDEVHLLITDIQMPGMSGVDLLRIARESDPNLHALILTAYPAVETAVETMKLGATDYITKPFHPDDLLATVKRLVEGRKLRDENRLLRRQLERNHVFAEMLGKSVAMQKVFDAVQRIAETDVDVLVIGETGTGKELIARSIHRASKRKDGPFVPIDCGAIPEHLMESEFFGYEKGAFTGAQNRTLGLLEFANGGTVFLDEIAQLPLHLQAKLLRALQERKIRRLGGSHETDIDIRIISATSLNLEQETEKKRFRLDLYHRIHVARVDLPPLRERTGDIPFLATEFLTKYAAEMGRYSATLSAQALEILSSYNWPGNVRELQNALKRTLAMARRERIGPEDLPDDILAKAGAKTPPAGDGFFSERERHIAGFEREYLKALLAKTEGDVSRAAREAKIPRGTFYRLLKNHALDPSNFRIK